MKAQESIIESIAAKQAVARFESTLVTLKFDGVPSSKVLKSIKDQGFKYNSTLKTWSNSCSELWDGTISSSIFKAAIIEDKSENSNKESFSYDGGFSMNSTISNKIELNRSGYDAIESIN